MRQHAGGTSLVKRVLESLGSPRKNTIIVDLFGHDGWAAMASLELNSCLCATAAHTDVEHRYVKAFPNKLGAVQLIVLAGPKNPNEVAVSGQGRQSPLSPAQPKLTGFFPLLRNKLLLFIAEGRCSVRLISRTCCCMQSFRWPKARSWSWLDFQISQALWKTCTRPSLRRCRTPPTSTRSASP